MRPDLRALAALAAMLSGRRAPAPARLLRWRKPPPTSIGISVRASTRASFAVSLWGGRGRFRTGAEGSGTPQPCPTGAPAPMRIWDGRRQRPSPGRRAQRPRPSTYRRSPMSARTSVIGVGDDRWGLADDEGLGGGPARANRDQPAEVRGETCAGTSPGRTASPSSSLRCLPHGPACQRG